MPTIRDGRGVLTEYETVPPFAVPSGPIERRQGSPAPPDDSLAPIRRDTASLAASRQRANAASAAESRARGAKAGGFVKGATKPTKSPPAEPPPAQLAPSKRMGVEPGYKRAPEVRERMRQGQLARYERLRTGTATLEPVPAPAPEPEPGIAQEYSAPDPTPPLTIGGGSVEGEDRCSFGTFIGQLTVLACDRPAGHEGVHRGRLIRVGILSDTITMLGHAAVPA